MAGPTFEKKKIPPKPQPTQSQKKKKKNAPDAPQPKWLFPPDEENPVLNPKAKTPEEIQQEKDEREKSLNYMKRRVHAVPDRPAPPPELLTLVGIFLTDFGFNSTSRLFTNERKGRKILNGWEDSIGTKIEKGTPTLEQIYREWYREWKIKKMATDDTSSSESGSDTSDSDSEAGVTTQLNGADSSDDDSEASSEGLGGSDVEMKDAIKAKGQKGKTFKKSSGSSSSSSTSESDADDEDEMKKPKKRVAATTQTKAKKSNADANTANAKPTVTAMVSKLKRKASSSDEDSDSDSSEYSEDEKPAKKTKTSFATTTAAASLPNGPSDSSSDGSEDSEESEEEEKPTVATLNAKEDSEISSSESSESDSSEEETSQSKTVVKIIPAIPKASSDSSATINGDVQKALVSSGSDTTSSSTSASDSSDEKPAKKTPAKKDKKHTGAKLTPLAELSAKGIQGHVSNQYQSYEYADKAYQDLSVTRGKGFTKEKNKKKRGSYRGGAIDTSGGKGYKFED